MERAGKAFKKHLTEIRWNKGGQRNIFRPNVLAFVSRDDKTFVGSSMSVSNFLRPLCLNERIFHLKPSLKNAIIRFEPLDTAEGMLEGWSSSAFDNKDYETNKEPCQKCQIIFSSLGGFIINNGVLANAGGNTFLGACAEYCPVNNFLPDGDDTETDTVMREHRDRCVLFFESYRGIRNRCEEAHDRYDGPRDDESLEHLRGVYNEVRPIVHIFGFKPECRLV